MSKYTYNMSTNRLMFNTYSEQKTTPKSRSLLNFDTEYKYEIVDEDRHKTLCEKLLRNTLTHCDTKWFKTSWLGIFVYVLICCLNYPIGRAIYISLGYNTPKHTTVRIFGDIVTVGWFSLGFIALPWHQWEQLTCIKERNIIGVLRFLVWWAGTLLTYVIYGRMGEDPFFQTSLADEDLTSAQIAAYGAVFGVIGGIVLYWLIKLCPCRSFKKMCNPEMSRKVVFLRLIAVLTTLFVLSYVLCKADDTCVYHLHHWWFGFSLIILSTATLDNWFDYFLQGIFWTFLIESLFNYGLTFGEFFI